MFKGQRGERGAQYGDNRRIQTRRQSIREEWESYWYYIRKDRYAFGGLRGLSGPGFKKDW